MLDGIRSFDVATYIETLQLTHAASSVKQQLAAVRILFDWLITRQVLPFNPAAAVRKPKHAVKVGVTPVLEGGEWRGLLDAVPIEAVRDLRDRALIATLTYSFARIDAALKMKVEDLRPRGAGWTIRLHEKGGKQQSMPWPMRCTPTSQRPALPRTARASCSAPARGMWRRRSRSSRWTKRRRGV